MESGGTGNTGHHMSENRDCLLKVFSVELTDRILVQQAEGLNLIPNNTTEIKTKDTC